MLVSESKMPKECDRRPKGVTVDFETNRSRKKEWLRHCQNVVVEMKRSSDKNRRGSFWRGSMERQNRPLTLPKGKSRGYQGYLKAPR